MATKKKQRKNSAWWNPQAEGETFQCKFLRWERITYDRGKKTEHTGAVLAGDQSGAIRKVGLGYVLLDLFAPVYKKVKHGDKILITYLGKKKRTRIFEASLNGKPLERSSGGGTEVKGKELDELFVLPF